MQTSTIHKAADRFFARQTNRKILLVTAILSLTTIPFYMWHRAISSPRHRLIEGVESADFAEMRDALARGADVNALSSDDEGMTPLEIAAWDGHTQVARFLISHGADPNAGGWSSPLTTAVARSDVDMIDLLIKSGALVNDDGDGGSTALWRAVVDGKVDTTELLLAHGANPRTYTTGEKSKKLYLYDVAKDLRQDAVAKIIQRYLNRKADSRGFHEK